jgi:hypothetical protein
LATEKLRTKHGIDLDQLPNAYAGKYLDVYQFPDGQIELQPQGSS